MYTNLKSYLDALRDRKQLIEIHVPVDPKLELAEIHRRVIAEQGPALLFRNIKGSPFPVVSNLFGTRERVELAFGQNVELFLRSAVELLQEFPPSLQSAWKHRSVFGSMRSIGCRHRSKTKLRIRPEITLDHLPITTSWNEDGGPFLTLPLVYTEHPDSHIHNLGIYRMQRFSSTTLGLHMQIGKGGGFHLARAKEKGCQLPVNVFLGGPPAVLLSAIAPLPENVPELLLASLILGRKVPISNNPYGPLPLLSDAEFILIGSVDPCELHPEGPFGDHFGYYSLCHDFPVFHCKSILHGENPILPVTVVGKPTQEDFYLGDYLQTMLSPLFPVVMPSIRDLWSYGETGFHSLSTVVVHERYKREALVSVFRVLGEGQLSLTKFLLVVDKLQDLKDFPSVLQYILERADFRTDLYIFANLSMDTLDYSGPRLNEGSKGALLGIGPPIRNLPHTYQSAPPIGIEHICIFCPGCLVVSGTTYDRDPDLPSRLARETDFSTWPLIVLVDNAHQASSSSSQFLWNVFTRFNPASDIVARETALLENHPSFTPPIVIDSRMKPSYPTELECDPATSSLVSDRWREYFSQS